MIGLSTATTVLAFESVWTPWPYEPGQDRSSIADGLDRFTLDRCALAFPKTGSKGMERPSPGHPSETIRCRPRTGQRGGK